MITLITGMPGAGKTLLLVSEFLTEARDKGRHIVADGIPELAITHSPAPEVPEWTKVVDDPASQDGKKLLFSFEQGSLVVIDECQRVFRPRSAGRAVPPEVAAFETHRHQGLDFILITQHPSLLDSNVRRLVGRHLHIRDLGILGRKIYEWPEATDTEKYKSAPVQRSFSLPKSSFSLYKSSSLHIKPKRGLPKGFVALGLTIPLILTGAWYAYGSIQKKVNPEQAKPSQVQTGQPSVSVAPSRIQTDPSEMLVEFVPVVPGRPETAPAYDALRVVKNMPQVVGCIATKAKCSCTNQQGLDAGLDNMQCRSWIASPTFDPYSDRWQVEAKTDKSEPKADKKPELQHQNQIPQQVAINDKG